MNNGSQDIPMEQMPPMDMQPDMENNMGGDFMPQDNMQQPPMDGGMGEIPNEYGADFDAGVEADEEQDPKKFIQQLTGKLSQSLQKYNDNNGQPDVDLNKYVAGMITKQAMKGLSEQDAEEIIDKVKADEDFSMDNGQEEMDNNGQMMNGGQQEMPNNDQMGGEEQQMNENQLHQQIKEIVNDILKKDKDDTPHQKPKNSGRYTTSPYTSPY